MPIFHDNVEDYPNMRPISPNTPRSKSRPASPLLARAELLKDDLTSESTLPIAVDHEGRPLSRGEIISRIKRRESPAWRFRLHQNARKSPHTSPKVSPFHTPERGQSPVQTTRAVSPQALPAEDFNANVTAGLEIARPRSALHSGDFHPDKATPATPFPNHRDQPITSPPAPWLFTDRHSYARQQRQEQSSLRPRERAMSHLISNVVLMPSTSPLAQSLSNSDLEYPSHHLRNRRRTSPSPRRDARRHTFSPASFQAFQARCFEDGTSNPTPVPYFRRDNTFPLQAHQPRRSFTSSGQWPGISTTHNAPFRPRGISASSDSSPLHHASMVGSYEESILRGRMSTTPSRPLNFIAQIGVLGKGNCKSSLRCPPHAVVPFPAVFYSYNSGHGRLSDNQPSPYVGLIDLEHHLPHAQGLEASRRRRRYSPAVDRHDESFQTVNPEDYTGVGQQSQMLVQKRRQRLRQRSKSPPKAPPGGSYRIPQQGQLQIIIKNPNKTAVKLFLVPYDLSDMEPGNKTFIRQRSYSAGPIIDMPLSQRKNLGTDRPEASLSTSTDPHDRPMLRYLIHLNICCPSKGRYYLYKAVRVVFANRVPDGKEKLRNEVQLPEPKYSVYKPNREASSALTPSRIVHRSVTSDQQLERMSATWSQGSPMSVSPQPPPYDHVQRILQMPGPNESPLDVAGTLRLTRPSIAQHSMPTYGAGPGRNYQADTPGSPTHSRSINLIHPRLSASLLDAVDGMPTERVPTVYPDNAPLQSFDLRAPHAEEGICNLSESNDEREELLDASTAFLQGRQSPSLLSQSLRPSSQQRNLEEILFRKHNEVRDKS